MCARKNIINLFNEISQKFKNTFKYSNIVNIVLKISKCINISKISIYINRIFSN